MRKTYLSHSLTISKILLAISKSIQVRIFDRGLGNRGNVCFTTGGDSGVKLSWTR